MITLETKNGKNLKLAYKFPADIGDCQSSLASTLSMPGHRWD